MEFDKPFNRVTDSHIGVGGVLLQEDEEGTDHALSFYSKKKECKQKPEKVFYRGKKEI